MNRALRALYITVILFASCDLTDTKYVTETKTEYIEVPVIQTEYIEVEEIVEVIEYVEVESFVEVEVTTVEIVYEYVDNVVYEIKEVYIMSETTSNEQAITEYDNYVSTDNKSYGISDGNLVEIENVTNLYKKDDVLYFNMEVTTTITTTDEEGNETEETSTSINAYSQVDSTLTLLEELPEEPDSDFIEFKDGSFKIVDMYVNDDGKYVACGADDETEYSWVYNETWITGYLMVDGACMMGDYMLYSVPTSSRVRSKGIYKYDPDNSAPKLIFGSGRVW